MDWICTSGITTCAPAALCDGCLGRDLAAKRTQARTSGAVWAERIASRNPEYRARETWPDDDRARAIARRRIAPLATDPRLVEPLAESCLAGAAAWWLQRPERYRSP